MRFVGRNVLAEEGRLICAKQRLKLVVSLLVVWLGNWLIVCLVGLLGDCFSGFLWLVGLLGDWLSDCCLVG
jgi:hypothetical protein